MPETLKLEIFDSCEKKFTTMGAQGKMCLRHVSQKNLTHIRRNLP